MSKTVQNLEFDANASGKRKPTLVLMAGLPGTGKTTLARALGQKLGWPVLDKDTVKTALLEESVPEAIAGPASYYLLLALCQDLLVQQQLSVIFDSPAAYPNVVERARQIVLVAGGQLKIIYCQASSDLRNQRLSSRLSLLSQMQSDPTTDEQNRHRFDHLPATRLTLSTQRSLPELVTEALAYLKAAGES